MSTNNQSTHNYRFSYSGISREKWAKAFGRADELRKELRKDRDAQVGVNDKNENLGRQRIHKVC